MKTAQVLDDASTFYGKALKAGEELMYGEATVDKMRKLLLKAATLEEAAGKIFLQKCGAEE